MAGVRFVPTTLRNIKVGERFVDSPDDPTAKTRVMAEVSSCASRPGKHIHLGSACYWLDAPVYRVVVSGRR